MTAPNMAGTFRFIAIVLLFILPSVHPFSNPSPFAARTNTKLNNLPPKLAELVTSTLNADRKIVVVTGGVLSGIGKGVTASSIGVLFRAMGFRVTALKIDPYLNVDAGTMSPFEHGEVFVLDDGGETDLDLGNYERFLSVSLTKDSNLSTGKIYQSVIERERVGEYLGKTVQVRNFLIMEVCELSSFNFFVSLNVLDFCA